MNNNINLITELYDIKRQNTDWEIKLENSSDLNPNIDLFSDTNDGKVEELSKTSFDITLIPNSKLIDNNPNNNHMTVGQPIGVNTDMCSELSVRQLNGNELLVEKCDQKSMCSPNGQKLTKTTPNHVYDGIKNVEQYVERRKINGITWYYCLWQNCNYGSNKSNHLVRHIRGHTGERPYACDWPNCGKKFTDSWKRKDHILSHNKKLFSLNQLNNKLISSAEHKSDNKLNHFVEMLNTNNNICEPIDIEIDIKPELSLVLKDNNKEDSDRELNMFIPEVIYTDIESNVDNVSNSETNPIADDLTAIQQYIERTSKDGKVWYLCKFTTECNYGSIKNQHLIRHLRSVHQYGIRPFPCEWPECGKSFTEAYKLKEHQLTHYRKLITTVGNNNKNSMNLIFDTKKNDDKVDNQIIISEAKDCVPPINGFNQSIGTFNRMTFNVSDAQTAQLLSPKKVVMSIKSVEQFVERRKIDGITRYFCQWPNCSYSSNKSNHLVRHITSHTNDRKEVCDFPGCGKKFTDVWKLRDHQLCHTPVLKNILSIAQTPPVSTSMALVPINSSDMTTAEDKDKPTFYTPNPHKILIESLRSPPLPLLPTLPFPENYDRTPIRHKSPTDIVMSIKNVEQYVERRKVNGITFYFCKWTGCNYGSNKSNHLVRHVRSHTGERPYPCDECDKKFTDSWKLKDHKSIHAKKQLEKTMTDQKIAFLNFLQNLSQNKNSLNERPNDFVDNSLDSSVKAITFGDTFNSNNISVEESVDLEENSDLNETKEMLSIDMICEQNLNQLEDNSNEMQEMDLLVPQVIIDESEDSYVNFNSTADDSNAEVIVPNQQIQYRPNVSIDDSFPGVLSIKNVEQYVNKVLKSDGNWYVCQWTGGTESVCGFSTQKSSYITQHVYRHLGERPYKCQWNGCDAKFNKKQNLKIHMTCHTGEQTFRCGYPNCYYTAISPEALTTHQKKHCGDKTFKCEWSGCCSQFATEIELLRHSKMHSGVRLHSCHFPNCDYASKYRNKLQIHIRRHTNTKPFICQIENCGKSFIVKDKLKRHENTVHKDLFTQQVIQL